MVVRLSALRTGVYSISTIFDTNCVYMFYVLVTAYRPQHKVVKAPVMPHVKQFMSVWSSHVGKFKSACVYCPLLKRTQLTCTTWVESLSKTRVCITAWPYHWSPFVRSFVRKELTVKFMGSCNQIEHCGKWLHCLTSTKHNCTSALLYL